MTSSIQFPLKPLEKLGCCALLYRCEFMEIARRIQKIVLDAFFAIKRTIVYSVNWVLNCGRVRDDFKLTAADTISKLKPYKELPLNSPQFEKGALKLAGVWLTADEMEEITTFMDVALFSQIIVRAAMLTGRAPIYPFNRREDRYVQFNAACIRLNARFNALSASDKLAILNHLDSEIFTFEEDGERKCQLRSPAEKPGRPSIPAPAVISEAAKNLWTSYKALALKGIQHDHPIMKGLRNLS